MSEILKHFALEGRNPRPGQVIVIEAIAKAFETKNTVIFEGPVGSGKSAIAMTLAKYYGTSHILTPRKSLQDQYYNDFSKDVCVMKGKGGYPCHPRLIDLPAARVESVTSPGGATRLNYYPTQPNEDENRLSYAKAIEAISKRIPIFYKPTIGCDEGPCIGSTKVKKNCTMDGERPCPYNLALEVAVASPHIVHNVHSFFFQNLYAESYTKRALMVIDECHDLESIVRGFLQTHLSVQNANLLDGVPSRSDPVQMWVEWFLKTAKLSFDILHRYAPDSSFAEQIEGYYRGKGLWLKEEGSSRGKKVTSTPEKRFAESLIKILDIYGELDPKEYIVAAVENKEKRRMEYTFTPLSLRGMPERLYLSYGEKRLLMSGTIYNKESYCRNIGLDPKDVEFISINSEFPVASRPIFAYSDLMTDNSFASWKKNDDAFHKMIENIEKVMDTYNDKKGLIHAPSYRAAQEIAAALGNRRILTHSREDFLEKLDYFCGETEGNEVFLSPTCQQGVDFKNDIARFQMILRVPFPNTSDDFTDYMRENNFMWYNYQSLIAFGQMIGRINRGAEDWGHTYLLDSRFTGYLKRNNKALQPWLTVAIKYR